MSCLWPSFDDFGNQEQTTLHGGGALLVQVALVGFAGHVGAQAQLNVGALHGIDGMGHGHHAGGVDCADLFDDVEKVINFVTHAVLFVRLQL
mgnify:CR=1 FL=1